jgi:hypothetical protein
MTHEVLSRVRLVADHNQFCAFDASHSPGDPLPEITDDALRRGWARTATTIYYFTVGQLWDFRLDLIRSSEPPTLGGAERVLANTLDLPTGYLAVGNSIAANNLASAILTPGRYTLFLRAFNLGAQADDLLPDTEFFRRSDLERYELFVIPGETPEQGVILGRPSLW